MIFFWHLVFVRLWPSQVGPKDAHEAPRGSQDAIWGSFLAVLAAKLGQVRSKKPRSSQDRPKTLKTLQDRPKRLKKNTIPKTIVHINVADIAEIDKDKTLQPPGAIKKGRAGGGVPPWGRQSAARPGGCGATACQTPRRNRRSGQKSQDLSNRSLHLTANLLWRSLYTSL